MFNLNLAFLDPGTRRWPPTRATPSTPADRCWREREAVLMPLLPERGFAPDLDAVDARRTASAPG